VKGEALKGYLDMLLLGVLADGPKHGYSVIEELRARSGGVLDLPEGTIYPALHRLEAQKHLTSTWSVVNGRRRRSYALTKRGQTALKDQWQGWGEFVDVVGRVVGVPWPTTT
jgi:PadR family transcriptional regulator